MVSTLLALEVERSRSPEWASDEAAGEFVRAVLDARGHRPRRHRRPGRRSWARRSSRVRACVIARAAPHTAQPGDWRARVLTVALRALRAVGSRLAGRARRPTASRRRSWRSCRPPRTGQLARAAQAAGGELAAALPGFAVTVASSRWTQDPVDLYRAGKEALLAANVAEAEGSAMLAFEDTGAYRLLLPAMSEDPGELERFYEETLAPLAAYDEQYETELVKTVEAYLDNDGNVAPTAEQLFTHRHTIRYRLERVKELSGHDITLERGAREAQPRPEGDAGAGHCAAARPGDRAGRRGRAGAPPEAGRLSGSRVRDRGQRFDPGSAGGAVRAPRQAGEPLGPGGPLGGGGEPERRRAWWRGQAERAARASAGRRGRRSDRTEAAEADRGDGRTSATRLGGACGGHSTRRATAPSCTLRAELVEAGPPRPAIWDLGGRNWLERPPSRHARTRCGDDYEDNG